MKWRHARNSHPEQPYSSVPKVKEQTDVARGMGSPRRASNRRRRTHEGPRTCVCANTLSVGWHTQGGKGELTSCRGTVLSAWQKPPVSHQGGRAGLPSRVCGRVVPGRHSSPIPAQTSRVSVAVRVRQGNRQGENGQHSAAGLRARRLPDVVTRRRPQRVNWAPLDPRWDQGNLAPGSPSTGSPARHNVPSGLRKGCTMLRFKRSHP